MSMVRENGRGGSEKGSDAASELAELEVTEKQLRYLEARFAGKDKTAAAKAAGVNRRTPYRWEDRADFRAARRLLKQERSAGIVHRIHKLREESLNTLIEEVKNGNPDLALRSLRVIGLGGPSPIDPIPAGVARDRAADQLEGERNTAGLLAGRS